jgi:type II secretory pathway pseudopilin PulG
MQKKRQFGFTLVETMASLAIFMIVSSIVVTGMVQMVKTQATVSNRTEMHTSVRSATELLQQEIGQAGRISLPTAVLPVTMTGPIAASVNSLPVTAPVSSTVNMFNGMLLDVDSGANFEVVSVTAVSPGFISAVFSKPHTGDPLTKAVPVQVSGAFGTGIIPPAPNLPCASTGYVAYSGPGTGSDCSTLKLYGDINGDGNLTYVEYKCDQTNGFLYRNEVANAVVPGTTKPNVDPSMYLLTNVQPNPDKSGCFSYQVRTASVNNVQVPFVTDVAVTMTVQTQLIDPQTHQYSKETKALLNITPRNVYYVWETTSLGEVPRNQPMPANISALL